MTEVSKWRQYYDDYNNKIKHHFGNDRSMNLYGTMAAHTVDATCGGMTFWLGISAAQMIQKFAGISASTPFFAKFIGTLAVSASSATALHFASLPRELYEENWAHKRDEEKKNTKPKLFFQSIQNKITARVEDFKDAPFTIYMVMGILCFKLLGGRMTSIAPSDFRNLGAFHSKRSSLPATLDYADSNARGVIREFGRLFGCHTCGTRNGVNFHADHMPPVLYVKRMNESYLRKMLGVTVTQRYYPQCAPCSNQQGILVKQGKKQLQTHFQSLRMYHTTGMWLVLFCTGGLYVGGSNFHETSDISSSAKVNDNSFIHHHSGLDHSLLLLLRQKERALRKKRKISSKPSEVQAIDQEIEIIEQCKENTKISLKRPKK